MASIESSLISSYSDPVTLELLRRRGILEGEETPVDLFQRVVNSFLEVETQFHTSPEAQAKFQKRLWKAIVERRVAFGSPLLTNIGREGKPTNSCTVIPVDLRTSEVEWRRVITPYYKAEIGSGFNLSDVDDPVVVLTKLNQLMLSLEAEVKRPPAGMAILSVHHPKVLEFISAKKEADFSTWRFNLSIAVTESFMQAVEREEEWCFSDGSTISARLLFDAIVSAAHYCGEPGIVFVDAVERDNPLPSLPYVGVSPCAEIAMASGEVCQFSYVNLSEMVSQNEQGMYQVDFKRMRKTAMLLTRALDDAVQISIQNAVSDPDLIASKRRISIGICGFAELLVKLGIPYGSQESLLVLADSMSVINFYTKVASLELAIERGAFPAFSTSRYCDEEWTARFKKYSTDQVTSKMWEDLAHRIALQGLRNAGTTALPPTGVAARIIHASYSLEPLFLLTDSSKRLLEPVNKILTDGLRTAGVEKERIQSIVAAVEERGSIPEHSTEISSVVRKILAVATEISFDQHIDVLAQAQRYIDESVSKTVNLPRSATLDMVRSCFLRAYRSGLKGMTVFRDRCLEERQVEQKGS